MRRNALNRVDQIGQPLEREILALHRNDDAVRCAKTIQRQQRQRGRAVDQNELVLIVHRSQRVLQPCFAMIQIDELYFGTRQFAVGAENVVAAVFSMLARGPHSAMPSSTWYTRGRKRALVDSAPHRAIALRIQIDQQYALTMRCDSRRPD